MLASALTMVFADLPPATQKFLSATVEVARGRRCQIYLVGGFVRDWVLGQVSWDIDFAVADNPLLFALNVAERLGARFVPLRGEPPTGRIVRWAEDAPDACADFTQLHDDVVQDARLRDFTCNALFVDAVALVTNGHAPVLDPLGGLEHLRQRLLVVPHPRVLRDDPVRLLRAFRFIATKGFRLAPETRSAIAQAAPLLLTASAERVLMEWAWILQSSAAHEQLLAMDELGVLTVLLPEVVKLKEVPAAGYHHLDGFHHTIEAVRMAENAMRGETENEALNALLRKVSKVFQQRFGYKRFGAWVLKFATLLHDVAKPQTISVDEEGDLHFYGHEQLGAEMAQEICERFKLSRRESELVVTLVRSHMRPVHLSGARHLTERAVRRFWRDLGDLAGIYCVVLSAADLMATRGPDMTEEHRQRHYHVLTKLLETYFALQEAREKVRIITGDEVMARYGIPPSPLVGRALRFVEEAALEGRIQTPEEAWALLDAQMAQWLQEQPTNAKKGAEASDQRSTSA